MPPAKSGINVGDRVNHKKLGKGEVLDVYPLGEDTCAVISFEEWGQKKIVLKYADLKVVEEEPEEVEEPEEAEPEVEAEEE
jgi:DNA helicase-2/ATP-dependent DNA helicase PcrA